MARFNFGCLFRPPLAAVVVLALHAPTASDAQTATFTSGVDMVPLTVTVTDSKGKYVGGLTGDDFAIFENGVRQSLSFFASDEVPVDLALMLDTSTSMRAELPLVQTAARGLVRKLRANDRVALIEVSDTAGVPQSLTSDHAKVDAAIGRISTFGGTALYDGLYIALKDLQRDRRAAVEVRRQVLVVVSDGIDTKSHIPFDDVVDLARRAGVSIYVIALRSEPLIQRPDVDSTILKADYAMRVVTRESGGLMFVPKAARELPSLCTAIAEELAGQYELGYLPVRADGDGAFRRVTVVIAPSINARAKTRSGYYAARSTGSR